MKQISSAFLLVAVIATYAMQQQESEGNGPEWRQRPKPEKLNTIKTKRVASHDEDIDFLIHSILKSPSDFKWRSPNQLCAMIHRPNGKEAITQLFNTFLQMPIEQLGQQPLAELLGPLLKVNKEQQANAANVLDICLSLANSVGKNFIIGKIISCEDRARRTFLHWAVIYENLPCIKVLLAHKADPNIVLRCNGNRYCTNYKCRAQHHPLRSALKRFDNNNPNHIAIVELLLKHGAQPINDAEKSHLNVFLDLPTEKLFFWVSKL